ncbi:MAG TPA: hypothetical protein VFC76_00775 [Oscillospiraceae bacterium]|nr:hypothetical protein [Oscillospiraceae bacterium]
MTTLSIIRTFFEILGILSVAFAIYHADKVNAFEAKLIRAIKFYRHRNKRLKAYEKIKKNRAFVLTVDNSDRNKTCTTVTNVEKAAG